MTRDSLRAALLRSRVPRYTSYPPANRFDARVGPAETALWLAGLPDQDPVSLYVHVPFCRRLCWFCACRTQGTRSEAPLDRYLRHLQTEIVLVRGNLPPGVAISGLHLGGGTPTLLSPSRLRRLARMLSVFPVTAATEVSVEIDPCEFDAARCDALLEMGLTRGSLGVQDFDPEVQAAIGRTQDVAATANAVRLLRDGGVGSVSVDLLCGLPHQTPARLSATLDRVLDLAPDRIALYGYAHVPWMARRQQLIPEASLPDAEARLDLEALARARLTGAGYLPVGIDHYALPGDSLARAAAAGSLRRNFQGYTTDRACALIGMGASAISRYPQGYAQNAAATSQWQSALSDRRLPTARGHVLTPEDRVTGEIIERLMCDARADIAGPCRAAGIDPEPLLARARGAFDRLPGAGVLEAGEVRLASFASARLICAALEGLSPEATGFTLAV